jgi:hypothetical protein
LIKAQFGSMPPAELAAALSDCADEIREESSNAPVRPAESQSAAPQPAATMRPKSRTRRLTDAAIPADTGVTAGHRYVHLRAEDPTDVAVLLHQALEVGALVIALEDAPALNDLINVELKLVDAQFSIRTQGRVVHTSPVGTAVEVSGIDREDRAALATILEDHRGELERARASVATKGGEAAGPELSDESSVTEPDGELGGEAAANVRRTATRPRHTLQAQPGSPVSSTYGSDAESTGNDIFSRHKRPSSSVTLGALNRRGSDEDFSARREVELIDPDLRVLTSSGPAVSPSEAAGALEPGTAPELDGPGAKPGEADTDTTFGPDLPWIEPTAPPARVERLDGERILDVLLQLSGSGFTGLLQTEGNGAERQIYFDGGLVVEITRRPRNSSEELGPMLHMADRIDEQQLAMAAAHAEENQTIFERSLLELELLDQTHIRHAIAGRLTYLLRLLCQVDRGSVQVFESHAMPAGYLPAPPLRVHVPVERIIYRRLFEQLKMLDADERNDLVAEHLDAYPEVAPDGYERLERVVLKSAHVRLVEQILRERRRLREVFTESSLSPSETAAVIHSLHRMGVLRFDTSLHKTIVRERFRENVTVKYLSVHKASYFEVLNVHWSSYDEVVEKAYRELAAQFDPAGIPESMEIEVVTRVKEIHERVETAYRALAKREHRQSYRKRIMPEYKLAHAIPLFLKQSELAERRSEWAEAIDSLRRVLEIDPDNEKAALRYSRIEQMQDGRLSPNPAESNF